MTDRDPPETPPEKPADAEAARLLEVGLSDTGSPGRAPPPPPAAMEAHFPELEILEVLGQGGMGVVYKARQRKLDRLVALKVLPQELGADPAFAERFRREARTLAHLQHLHIVGVHEFGEVDGFYYLVMEYVDGLTLRQLMATGELSTREALAIVPQICDALQYAHDAGVVHRDIKPENILLDRAGRVKVADFGLAKMIRPGEADFTLTGTDQVMGTLHYMAPEQYKTPQDVDHRADIFSLGVVFFEMLTGELPVGRFANPSEAPGLDERIDEIVMRTLERQRELRYQQADEVKADVRTFVADTSTPAPAPTPGEEGVVSSTGPGHHSTTKRTLCRWAHWSFWMIFVGAGAGLLVAGIIYSDVNDGHRSRIAGLWTGFGAAAVVVSLAIMGIITTRRRRAELRGLGLAILSLVIGCIGLTVTLAAVGQEQNSLRNRMARESVRALDPRPQLPFIPYIQVEGTPDSKMSADLRAGVLHTWTDYLRILAVSDLELQDFEMSDFYTPADLRVLKGMDPQAFKRLRAANELGMGLVGATSVQTPPSYFRLRKIVVDKWGRQAIITARVVAPVLRNGKRANPVMTFLMKRSTEGWMFAIGKVSITE